MKVFSQAPYSVGIWDVISIHVGNVQLATQFLDLFVRHVDKDYVYCHSLGYLARSKPFSVQ